MAANLFLFCSVLRFSSFSVVFFFCDIILLTHLMESHTRATSAHHKSDGSPAGNDALGCCLGMCARESVSPRIMSDLYIASYWIFMRAYPLAMDLCSVLSTVIMSEGGKLQQKFPQLLSN